MSEPVVRKHALAVRDLEEQSDYIENHASPRAALRFLAAADRTFELLASMPFAGEEYHTESPALTGLRRFRVSALRGT